jgi:hypothetical protein
VSLSVSSLSNIFIERKNTYYLIYIVLY